MNEATARAMIEAHFNASNVGVAGGGPQDDGVGRAGAVASRRRWRHERQPRRQPGELKRAVHIVCPAQDAQPVMRAQAGSGVDKDSDADRVDELQPAQIDDDLGRVRSLDAGKFIVQRMGALEIKLAAGRYDVRVAVARGPQRER